MDFNFDTGAISLLQYLDCSSLPPLGGTAGVLTIIGTGALIVNLGTTAQRPTPDNVSAPAFTGAFRYNSDITALEYFDGLHWQTLSFASGAVSSFQTSLSGLTPTTATTGAVTLAGTLGVASGGTGDTTLTTNGVLFGNGTSAVGVTAAGTQYQVLQANVTGVPVFSAVHLDQGAAVTGVLSLANGGTNSALTGSNGSIIYNNGTSLVNSTVGTLGQVLTSSGAGAPTWTTASSTVTTNQIVQGDGTGAFTANGATFQGTGSFSGVTLNGTVTNATDATTKQYVDSLTAGLSWKQAAVARTTADLGSVVYSNGALGVGATLTNAGTQAALVLDGITVTTGQRVVIANQAAPAQNGIYTVTNTGSGSTNWVLTRANDNNQSAEMDGAAVFIEEGTLYADTAFVQVTDQPITIGTTAIVWTQFAGTGTYTAGTALTLTGTQFNVRFDNTTVFVDGSNNLAVKSSGTTNQVLLSQGTGNTAAWGAVPLGNSNAVSGTLATTNGGTGTATAPTAGQILVGTTGGSYVAFTLASGTGISTTTGSGTLQVNNTGVLSVQGTANQVLVNGTSGSAQTGAVTLTLPATISVTNIDITSLTTNGILYSGAGGQVLSTASPTNGQILIGSTGAAPVLTTITAGTGVSVTNGAGSITIANTGVTSVSLNDTSTTPIFTTSPTSATTGAVAETIQLQTQSANVVFAGPASGGAAQPTFRALVAADMPASAGLKLYNENPSTPTAPSATGTNAVAIGNGALASATNSQAFGSGSNASVWGSQVFANGDFATAGDAQAGLYVLRNQTTNGTTTELFLDGTAATQRIVLPNNSVATFDILVTARRTDASGGGAGYRFVGVVKKDGTAATNTFVGTPSKTIIGETDVPWDSNVLASTINGNLEITVNGQAGKTIRWVAVVRTTEVTN